MQGRYAWGVALSLLAVRAGAEPAASGESLSTVPVSEPAAEATADDAQASANPLIGEIIVTAQKREESLQSVPMSIQAFSAESLNVRGIDKPAQLQSVTPGMQYNTQLGYSQIYIRGVGTDSFIPSSDATVATYIDGVYYPMAFGAAVALGAIERVEVLKGPQGTLFGRNSTGGAINIVMKQPDDTLAGSLSATRQRYDDTRLTVYTNIPLSRTFAFTVGGSWSQNDSYYKPAANSPLDGIPGDTGEGFAVKARWAPLDEFDLVAGYTYVHDVSGTSSVGAYKDPKPLGQLALIGTPPDYQTSENHAGYGAVMQRVATLKASYALSAFDTKLILADIRNKTYTNVDFDGSPRPFVVIASPKPHYDSKTAELQLLSNDESWGANWLKWIAGAYYLHSDVGYDPLRITLGADLVRFLTEPGGLGLLPGLLEPVIDVVSGLPLAGALVPFADNGVNLDINGKLDTKSVAGFVQATISLTDRLDLTLGGRYQRETRKLGAGSTTLNPTESSEGGVPFTQFASQKKESSNFSPKVVLDYKLTDDALVYVLFAKGYKSGTYNIVNVTSAATYVEPETLKSYELGYKDTLLDGAMRFSAAIFENRAKNVQGQVISFLSGGLARLLNNGTARIRGAEFDSTWQVFPQALPGFVMTAGACYLDGEYTDYPDGTGYDPATGLFFGSGSPFPGRDFSGNTTVRTPKWTGSLGLSHVSALGPGSLELAVDGYYNDGAYFSAQNTSSAKDGSYTTLAARASYLFDPWNARITVFGNNLTNEKYYLTVADSDFATGNLIAPKAIYGVRLNWEF